MEAWTTGGQLIVYQPNEGSNPFVSAMQAHVYVIFNARNGKIYVGWTSNPKERWRKHKKNALNNLQYYLYRAMSKELDTFEFKIIATYFNEVEAMMAEKYWIEFFRSNQDVFGYNMTEGGEGCVRRGEKNPMFGRRGCLSPNFGRRFKTSPETIQKLKSTFEEKFRIQTETRKLQVLEVFQAGKPWGSINALALDWEVSHTQVRRFIKTHMPEFKLVRFRLRVQMF